MYIHIYILAPADCRCSALRTSARQRQKDTPWPLGERLNYYFYFYCYYCYYYYCYYYYYCCCSSCCYYYEYYYFYYYYTTTSTTTTTRDSPRVTGVPEPIDNSYISYLQIVRVKSSILMNADAREICRGPFS